MPIEHPTMGHPAPTTAYHYVLTVKIHGGENRTADGLLDIRPGTSRKQIYDKSFAAMTALLHANPLDLTVVHWSLEPDRIGD
jgi:hypothetical protein